MEESLPSSFPFKLSSALSGTRGDGTRRARSIWRLMAKQRASVVFLDDSEDLRELLPLVLEPSLGVKCMCFGSLKELQKHANEVLGARVAILDVNLGPNVPDGIDAFNWLSSHGFHGKIFFFTGHARTNPQLETAERNGIEILEKPLEPAKLISSVMRALNGNS